MIRNVANSYVYYVCGPGYIETNRFYYRMHSEKYIVIDIDLTSSLPESVTINFPSKSRESLISVFGFNNYGSFLDLVNDIAFNPRFHVENPFYSFINKNEDLISITVPSYLFVGQISSNNHLYLAVNIDNDDQSTFYFDGKIYLTYFNNIGLSPYCSYSNYDLEGISLRVNKANGDLFLLLDLFNTLNPKFPISFPLLYHKDTGLVFRYEYQFDINNDEIIVTDSSNYQESFVYIDTSDEYFSPNAYGLIDELDNDDLLYFSYISGSYLIKRNNALKICTKDKTELFFVCVENNYRIYEIDKENYKINFIYNDFGQLTSIIEGGNVVTVSYSTIATKIPFQISSSNSIDPHLLINQTNSGYLFQLITPLNSNSTKEISLLLDDAKLIEIKDNLKDEKYQINYDCDNVVSSVVYKKNNVEVNSEAYLFNENKTEISSLYAKNSYYFDKYLRPVTVIDNNFNVSSFNYNEIEKSNAGNVSSYTKSINKRRNYILNHLFDNVSGWNFSGNGSYQLVDDSVFGDTSLKVITSSNQTLTISQTIIRPQKEPYILKALVKRLTDSNVTIILTGRYRTTSILINSISTMINVNGNIDEWIDYSSEILEFPSNVSSIVSLSISIIIPENTIIVFDHFSLNEDYIDEKINLINNGYLEKISNNIPSDWTFINKEDEDISINSPANPFLEETHNTKEFKFASKTFDGIIKEMYQNVGPLTKGKYVLSIISKCFSYPNDIYHAFVKLTYLNNEEKEYTFDFLRSYSFYQCLSRGIVIDKNVSSLIVGVRYNGVNEAIFDSFELIKEGNFINFKDDIRKNIASSSLSVTSFDDYSNSRFILNNANEQILNIYDTNKKYLIKNSYMDNGNSFSCEYDDHENIIFTSINHEEETINQTSEYINNLIISSRDEFDVETTYLYDDYHRLIEKKINESKFTYQYDYKNNLTNLSLFKKSTGNLESSNAIIYNSDNSINVTSNSNQSCYEFIYNSIGQTSLIKVNNEILESFAYNNKNLLNAHILNNQTFLYEYDSKNRLSNYSFLNHRYEYFYDNSSNLVRIFDENDNSSSYYAYNSSGTLEKEVGKDYKYLYEYDIDGKLTAKKNFIDDYILSHDYKYDDKSSFNDHIIRVNDSYDLDTILPYLPSTGIRGVKYQTDLEKTKDNSINRFVYKFLSNSNYLDIDLNSTYLDARSSSYTNVLKSSKTILLWIKATLLTNDFLSFYNNDDEKRSFSLSGGHLTSLDQTTNAHLSFGKYNLLTINIYRSYNTSIYSISINGSNYEEFVSLDTSPINKLRIRIDDGATTNLLCAFLGNQKIKENELLKLYDDGSELLELKDNIKEGISFNNASNSNSLDLYTFDNKLTSIRRKKVINESLYDEASFSFEPNLNKYVFNAINNQAIKLPNKLTKGSIAIRFKLFSNSGDTSNTRRSLLSFNTLNGNEVVSFKFSNNKIYLQIGNFLSSYSFTKRDEYVTIRINFNETDVKVDLGLPLATIKIISQNINLDDLTLYIGNNYINSAPLNGYIDFVAIRDVISSEFISPDQLINICVEKDHFNRVTSITNLASSYRIEYNYDKTQIEQELHSNNDIYDYSYDDFGRITSVFKNNELYKSYSYDVLGRLINDGNNTYSYDSNGNILTKGNNNYQYNNIIKDRLEVITDSSNNEIYRFNYTDNSLYPSSITKEGVTNNLSWLGNMLTSYGGYSYFYDGQGRRIKKSYTTESPFRNIKIEYKYEDGRLICLKRNVSFNNSFIFFEYDESNQLVAASYKNIMYFYIHDILNNIIGITDSNGNYIVKYDYDGFGNITENVITTNSTHLSFLSLQPFRYKDYIYDSETSLYYITSRYYDPEIGRFISPDSVDYLDSTTINGLNLYAYCGNDPVNRFDPTGHDWQSFWNGVGDWFSKHWIEVTVGTAFIVGGAVVTALTCGAGTTAWAAFGSALLSSAIQVGAGVAAGVVVNGVSNLIDGNDFFDNVGDTIASSYMLGGILSGGSQMLSGGLRVLRSATGFKGFNFGEMRLLSPDKLYFDRPGATLFKFNEFAIDAGRYGLHMHTALTAGYHIPIIPLIVGLHEYFN